MALKITPDDIIGGQAWWLKQGVINHPERSGAAAPSASVQAVANQQNAEARKVDPMMPTRTRGGGYRQPGMSESEINDFAVQGNGEVVGLTGPKDMSKEQAQQVAAQRADGILPEQEVKTPVDRAQRTAVDEDNISDPASQARVNRMAEEIQGNGGPVPTVDSYAKMLEYLKAQNIADADAGKRARRREVMAAIGDGISAISSLYQTTKGAPPTYTYGKDMSQVMRDRYDRLTAQRKADSDKYLNYLKVQNDAEVNRANQEYRLSRAKYYEGEQERKAAESDAKIKREDAIAEAKQRLIEANAKKAEADTVKKKGENQYAITYWERLAKYLEAGRPEEEAKRLANADAAAAEQEVLNAKENREQQKVDNQTTNAAANKTRAEKAGRGRSSGGSKSKSKKKKQSSLYGKKKKLY